MFSVAGLGGRIVMAVGSGDSCVRGWYRKELIRSDTLRASRSLFMARGTHAGDGTAKGRVRQMVGEALRSRSSWRTPFSRMDNKSARQGASRRQAGIKKGV